MSGDQHFRDRWGISSPHQINFGGIIIGKNSTFVKYVTNQSSYAREIANQAFRIRDKHFYKHLGMRLLTWDNVLQIAESQTISHQKITGDSTEPMDLRTSSVAFDAILVKESVNLKIE
jgi:hypothetical protein